MPYAKVGTAFHMTERRSSSTDHGFRIDAPERTERPLDPDRPRQRHGPVVSRLLDPGSAARGIARERLPAGACEDSVGSAAGVPRQRRPIRVDRRVLRPSRRVTVVWTQRGRGPALLLSRLEIRRDRPVHRRSLRARRKRLLQEDQAQVIPAGAARAGAVDLPRAAGETAAAAGMGVRDGYRRSGIRLETDAGMELA